MKARLTAAGFGHGAARPGSPPAPEAGEDASARVAEARSRARERGDRQRQGLRPLGVVFLAVVVTASAQAHPAPALHGAGLAVALLLVVYAAAVLTAISVGWARRGSAAQAAIVALIGGCGVALAVLQPHGPVEIAASLGVWIAAVRLPPRRPGRGRRRGDHGRARRGGRPDRAARRPSPPSRRCCQGDRRRKWFGGRRLWALAVSDGRASCRAKCHRGSQVVEQAVSGSCEERIPLSAREREDRIGGDRTAYHHRLALHGNLNARPALALPRVPHRLFPCRSSFHRDPSSGFGQ